MNGRLPTIVRKFIDACERIEHGTLRVTTPHHETMTFGDGAPEGELKINDWSVVTAFVARGEVGVGETYCEGGWDSPDIDALMRIACLNATTFSSYFDGNLLNRITMIFVDRITRRNSRSGSSANIRAHYDVGNAFYKLWLDETMTYSSAVFEGEGLSLEAAQTRKYDRILSATKGAGERVLEIGCGWGGFAERASEQGRDVTGISISPSQVEFAIDRLKGNARIKLQDYRDVQGTFDSIVSIEMIEAVGEKYWPSYFKALKGRLSETGTALLQAIVVEDENFANYRSRSDFTRHYIFPGGMLLSPGNISVQAAAVGLRVEETFRFGSDYTKTLREWFRRFTARESAIRDLGYDDKFLRCWRFYLQACAATFATQQTDVVQVKLTHA